MVQGRSPESTELHFILKTQGGKVKRLAILGSTGSIGTQTLEIVSRYPDRFSAEVLTAYSNVDLLVEQTHKFNPDTVIIGNEKYYTDLKEALGRMPVKVYAGSKAIEETVQSSRIDMVVAAMVGYSGLRPVMSAIRAGKNIALANKETLVVGGELIGELVKKHNVKIIPVDSEHSAILQCLVGELDNPVEKITLTASGGPFREYTLAELGSVSPTEALRHPNWDMGRKISVDSASMMNKGLEVIEAHWLFDIEPSKIDVVIHPQSIIHSLVHFADGSVKAQMGLPDMRLPILYALEFPDRIKSDFPRYDLTKNNTLTFQEVDIKKFRNLALAYSALETGGNMPCIMNAANEVAVEEFLSSKIGFLQMTDIIEEVMNRAEIILHPGLEALEESNIRSRRAAQDIIKNIGRK